jgi:hypothetical protein
MARDIKPENIAASVVALNSAASIRIEVVEILAQNTNNY